MASVAGYLLAILLRSPATMFYTPAIIPLVPGGRLYYTMYAAIKANGGVFSHTAENPYSSVLESPAASSSA
jgi:uncharacterized membrane protein YjjB (DUF3815 family)